MKNFFGAGRRKTRVLIAAWVIFAVALVLRVIALDELPARYQAGDEQFNLWAGSSMLAREAPLSWTYLTDTTRPTYQGRVEVGYPIHQPVFDHPPLFQLVTGAFGHLAGSRSYEVQLLETGKVVTLWDIALWRLRLLPVGLFAISFWLLWKIMRMTSGPGAALVAVLIFGGLCHGVVHHRLVVADSLVTPLVLLGLLALEKWRRGRISGGRALGVTGVCVFLAVGAKLSALAMIPAVVLWSQVLPDCRDRVRLFWTGTGAGLAAVFCYGVFGWLVDWQAFSETLSSQSERFTDLQTLFRLIFIHPLVRHHGFTGWIAGGWLVLFVLCAVRQRGHGLQLAGLGYLLGYVFFAPVDIYGWHHLTFTPFLCGAWGVAARDTFRNPTGVLSVITLVLLGVITMSLVTVWSVELRLVSRLVYAGLVALLLIPMDALARQKRMALRLALVAILAVGIALEVGLFLVNQRVALRVGV